jgi:dolichol-phosphate mannosyltransferase
LLNITQRRGVRQFVKFGTVGASGLVINFVIAHVLEKSTALPHAADFAIGYVAGGISNWYLNRIWTFRSSGHPFLEGVQFLTVTAISLGFGSLVWWIAGPFGHAHFSTTWLCATLVGTFFNFFLNKYWTFKDAS